MASRKNRQKKTICLIPARSGSKGLPNKNMLFVDHKPMIFHTIDAAIESGCFEKENIFVSTDSPLYKEICETRGINVILRKPELSTDFTTSFQVNEDFLQNYDDDQVFVLLQVTSPLRTGKHIKEAMEIYENSDAENVVSFAKVDKPPKLFTELDENNVPKDIFGADKNYRRQNEKRQLFMPNGAIYISSKAVYLKNESYFSPKTIAYLMEKEFSADVDDYHDFIKVTGEFFFDYKKREKLAKIEQGKIFEKNLKKSKDSIIIGDSRIQDLKIPHFSNLAIAGVTLNTIVENLQKISEKSPKKALVSIGVNDISIGYENSEIKENFKKLFEALAKNNTEIFATEINFTLFRHNVDNSKIAEINAWLEKYCRENQIKFLKTNNFLSKDGNLRFEFTSDGLHFNEDGKKILNKNLRKFVK